MVLWRFRGFWGVWGSLGGFWVLGEWGSLVRVQGIGNSASCLLGGGRWGFQRKGLPLLDDPYKAMVLWGI